MTFNCEVCGVEKTIPMAWFKRCARHTCGAACRGKLSKRAPRARPEARLFKTTACDHCGAEISRTRSRVRARNFCGHACAVGYWRGRKHGPQIPEESRIGMTYTKSGYVYEFAGLDRSQNGYVQQHRLVMERAMGRRLESTEVVHHLNGDKSDNRLDNLEVLTSGEHSRLHAAAAGGCHGPTCPRCGGKTRRNKHGFMHAACKRCRLG